MRLKVLSLAASLLLAGSVSAQIDSSLLRIRQAPSDSFSTGTGLNMDAVYNRPFLKAGKLPVSLGGYVEANFQRSNTKGVNQGNQFQFRRLTLFVASTISKRVKFITEIEFENEIGEAEGEGGPKPGIAIEFAAVDVALHPLLNLRSGIIVNPIGAFNQNHDGPKWEFTDRPVSSTQMLPATFSSAGVGLYGKYYKGDWMAGYEAYLTNGLGNGVIENDQNRTSLPAGKNYPDRHVNSNSGTPTFTGKVAVRNKHFGEIGLSYMGGGYSKPELEGNLVDVNRSLQVYAIDYNNHLPGLNTYVVGEFAWVHVDLPPNYIQSYGSRQKGGFLDIVQPILKRSFLGWDNAVLNLAVRLEYVDWNVGKFSSTGDNIGDDLVSIMPAISFRPTPQTVFRFNYRFQDQRDVVGNPAVRTRGFNIGVSSYF